MENSLFLLERVLLRVVVHVPSESHPELVNEVTAGFLFLILGREIEIFLGVEILCQGLHGGESLLESVGHRGERN